MNVIRTFPVIKNIVPIFAVDWTSSSIQKLEVTKNFIFIYKI